jgi:parallel beta-helix repeat protein
MKKQVNIGNKSATSVCSGKVMFFCVIFLFCISYVSADLIQFTNQGPNVAGVSSLSVNLVDYSHPDTSKGYDRFDQEMDTSISPNDYNFVTYFPFQDDLGEDFNADVNFIPYAEVGDSFTVYLSFDRRTGGDFFDIPNKISFKDFDLSDNINGVTDFQYELRVNTDGLGVEFDNTEVGLVSDIMATAEKETGEWLQDLPGGLDVSDGDYYGELTLTAIGEDVEDIIPPAIYVDNVVVDEGEEILIEFGATDVDGSGVDSETWRTNDTRFEIDNSGWFSNTSIIDVGVYSVLASVDDVAGNTASDVVTVTVNDVDEEGPVLSVVDIESNDTEFFEEYFSASDESGVDDTSWRVNDTRFEIANDGRFYNPYLLSPGIYNVLVSVNDTLENVGSEEVVITILDSCIPEMVNTSWSEWSDQSCSGDLMSQSRFKTEYDSNVCLEVDDIIYYEYQSIDPIFVNSSWSSWSDTESCQANDFLTQERSLTSSDSNGCASDIIYTENQEASCDFCTPEMVNTSWSEWSDQSCSGDHMSQSRFKTEYDSNVCLEVDDTIYYEYQSIDPIFVNSSWSPWSDTESCQANDFLTQERSLTSSDSNGCASDIIYTENQEASCDFCTPEIEFTDWSGWSDDGMCLENNIQMQLRTRTEYDSNYCLEVDDVIHTENQETHCDYRANFMELDDCSLLNQENTKYVLTDDVSFSDGKCFEIDGEDITLDCDGYTISSNKKLSGIYASGENIIVENCEINVREGVGIYFDSVVGAIVRNNEIVKAAHAIYFLDVDDSQVLNNSIQKTHYHGIYGRGSENNLISGNDIYKVSGPGIFLQKNSDDNVIEFNEIRKAIEGVMISYSYENEITENEIFDNHGKAVWLSGGGKHIVTNNLIYDNGLNEVYKSQRSSGNTIEDNVFEEVSTQGMEQPMIIEQPMIMLEPVMDEMQQNLMKDEIEEPVVDEMQEPMMDEMQQNLMKDKTEEPVADEMEEPMMGNEMDMIDEEMNDSISDEPDSMMLEREQQLISLQ